MDISIIIPAYNEANRISNLLDCLFSQKTDLQYEIILVDNGSNDLTSDIANSYGIKVLFIENEYSIASVRNYGVSQASGKVLAFLDADCLPPEHWLQDGYDLISQPGKIVGIIGGPYTPGDRPTWVQKAWLSVRPKGRMDVNYVSGGNFFILKELFLSTGGFDESLETGEDYEFCLRVRRSHRVVSDDRLSVGHLGDPANLLERMKREIWYGKNMLSLLSEKKTFLSFWATVVFLLSLIGACIAIIALNFSLVLLFIFINLSVMTMVSWYKCSRVGKYKYLFPLIIVNYSYFTGRAVALLRALPYSCIRTKKK